jgi:hypothetical protein
MADPVVFDDGGSTRVKRLMQGGIGALNGLLDVDPNANPPGSSDSVHGPFTHIRVVTIDQTGLPNVSIDSALVANDNFTITSANGQTAVGAIDVAGKLTIALQGLVNNVPLVEARQFDKKRRYEVTNAGGIQQIAGTINGAAANFNVPGQNIYTAVIVT